MSTQTNQPVITDREAQLAADLAKTRDAMYAAIAQYRALFADATLADNRSKFQRDAVDEVFRRLNQANGDLERLSQNEGTLALLFTALTSALAVKDQVNELKFSNALLVRQIKELQTKTAT